jgi:hypothetical protein
MYNQIHDESMTLSGAIVKDPSVQAISVIISNCNLSSVIQL